MNTTKNNTTPKSTGFVARTYQKIIRNIQEKRIKEQRTQLQAILMLGSVRRVK